MQLLYEFKEFKCKKNLQFSDICVANKDWQYKPTKKKNQTKKKYLNIKQGVRDKKK